MSNVHDTETPAIADPTGEQYRLASTDGRVRAHIAQVGASLRGLTVDEVDLIAPYALGTMTPGASGIVLVPWPNRIRDGAWTQRGRSHQLAVSEPKYSNASHGLLRFASYAADDMTPGPSLELRADVVPQTGYPFHLATSVTYELTGSGIDVTHRVQNVGGEPAPAAVGAHPYLTIGDVDTAQLVVRSSGTTRFVTDERQLPVDELPVDAATDLRQGRVLGETELDTAYAHLRRDDDGRARHTLTAPDGRVLTLWQGIGFDYVQIFTSHTYPGRPLAVAIEPMTAPADAFNSGRGLRWLESGETWTLRWGLEIEK